ncbi:MAG TPA: hypothetical protein DEO62_02620 [Lachnospiraceae bacterium]|nr:hypothetical protein [Lachnospiraceae bacterium]
MGNRVQEHKRKSLREWIIYIFGFYKNPPYIEDRLKEADVRSSIYLTVTVIGMEIWMLIRYVKKYVITGKCATVGVFFKYTYGYWILLGSAILLLIYSSLYMLGKLKVLKRFSRPIIFIYFCIGIYFGINTSLVDFSKGKMIICFLSMSMYMTFIFVVRPYISLILTLIAGYGFIYIIDRYAYDKAGNKVSLESGDLINYTTFFITLTVLYITIYYQRYSDAQKAYQLQLAALRDDTTGAPNIIGMEQISDEYTEKLKSEGKTPIYIAFDIKNFKTYNDRYDYDNGDKLLKEMAGIVKKNFPGEPYARHSADKFIVLTSKEGSPEKADKVREDLMKAHSKEKYLDVSAGSYIPVKEEDGPRRAMDYAQYAIYLRKHKEGFFISEFDEKCKKTYETRNYVLNNLDTAIREGYIKAFYQPVIDSSSGKVCGCEALARWIDPDRGMISPGQFIPVLEESRQIHKLDKCIYEDVLRRLREAMDANLPVLPVSLNFSRLDFELMDAVEELEEKIEKYNIPKSYVHVEITESALTESEEILHKAVEEFHKRGYVVWLDDFGSGYSSMNVLKDFRFDLLKIDMVFLKGFAGNNNSKSIIKNIIDLANTLHMETLTEGVESEDAVEFLKEAGCKRMQGYYYGKPQPYEELLEKIKDGTYELLDEIVNK